ncbi:hypothetical protein BBJ28_00013980 [Nothophytophthora sp. Chile5]|nr:hypothetical protein BBJ28_00013980 [Nothophytophthora sp. Chile5]
MNHFRDKWSPKPKAPLPNRTSVDVPPSSPWSRRATPRKDSMQTQDGGDGRDSSVERTLAGTPKHQRALSVVDMERYLSINSWLEQNGIDISQAKVARDCREEEEPFDEVYTSLETLEKAVESELSHLNTSSRRLGDRVSSNGKEHTRYIDDIVQEMKALQLPGKGCSVPVDVFSSPSSMLTLARPNEENEADEKVTLLLQWSLPLLLSRLPVDRVLEILGFLLVEMKVIRAARALTMPGSDSLARDLTRFTKQMAERVTRSAEDKIVPFAIHLVIRRVRRHIEHLLDVSLHAADHSGEQSTGRKLDESETRFIEAFMQTQMYQKYQDDQPTPAVIEKSKQPSPSIKVSDCQPPMAAVNNNQHDSLKSAASLLFQIALTGSSSLQQDKELDAAVDEVVTDNAVPDKEVAKPLLIIAASPAIDLDTTKSSPAKT